MQMGMKLPLSHLLLHLLLLSLLNRCQPAYQLLTMALRSLLQQSNACIAHGAAIKSSRVVTLHVLQYTLVVLHIQAAAAAARQVPAALTLAPEDLAAPPPAADPLGTGSAGAQTTLAVSSEPAARAAAPNLPELDRLAKTGQVRAFLIHGAKVMQAMPCYGSTLLSGAIVACYQEAQTATKLRP